VNENERVVTESKTIIATGRPQSKPHRPEHVHGVQTVRVAGESWPAEPVKGRGAPAGEVFTRHGWGGIWVGGIGE